MVDPQKYRTPGQLLQVLLEERGWTQRVLAMVLEVGETSVNKIVADKQPLTPELAIALEEVFQTVTADTFMEVQRRYDLAKARIAAQPDPARQMRMYLFGDLPISEMVKRGWLDIDDVRDKRAVERSLMKFFGTKSLEEIEVLPHAAKKTQVAEMEPTPAQLAWLYRVKEIAADMLVPQYTPGGVRAAVPKLASLLASEQEIRKVPRILLEAGIRFLVVESLPGAKIDGVCLWLDDQSPVIAMSMRHDRIDNFWFVLRHELEHVIRLHGRSAVMLDTELEGERAGTGETVSEEERAANLAATNFCIPSDTMDRFIARKAPFFAERDILGFAATLNVHPGIVAGQLQHRTGKYERFRDYLVKVRSIIRPSAIVDGWGDVAPVET